MLTLNDNFENKPIRFLKVFFSLFALSRLTFSILLLRFVTVAVVRRDEILILTTGA